ncbi:uncharacterized protein FFC1_15164 [Fusarium fujikuroi]|nr:uncharacterized protein FFC1_15164 [Fusarium fujikuroi]
MTIKCSFKKP